MPQYIIYRKRGKIIKLVGFTPNKKSIRAAWNFFKKNWKRRVHKDWQYHLYAMNHSRFWDFKNGKWVIDSYYDNHKKT